MKYTGYYFSVSAYSLEINYKSPFRDVVDEGSNLVQPRSSRSIYSAYIALTSAELTEYIR